MKLGIVVVYMVSEQHGDLLELHLDRIARHTGVPYAIHGSTNRLLPRFRDALAARDAVHLHELEPTPLRGAAEHSWFLEQLVEAAIADGATHVVTLHVDSFPVADGWAELLSERAGDTFATVDRIGTACLFFSRQFYMTHRPRFLASDELQKSEAFAAYLREISPTEHSGVGYGFAAYQAGLPWYSMPVTAHTTDPNGSFLYEDALFHVQGAFRLSPRVGEQNAPVVERIGYRRFDETVRFLREATPAPFRRVARKLLGKPLEKTIDAPRERWLAAGMSGELTRLLADPDLYLERLRAGELA